MFHGRLNNVLISGFGLVVGALALAGCASSEPSKEGSTADRVCVNVRQITSMEALSDRHVLVKATGSGNSLFTVEEGCHGLALARAIAMPDATTRVCGDGQDFLTFRDPAKGVTRCRIVNIEAVADEKAARALIEESNQE